MTTARRSRSPEGSPDRTFTRSRSPRPDKPNDSALSKDGDPHEVRSSIPSLEEFKEDIEYQAACLRQHLGLKKAPGVPAPDLSDRDELSDRDPHFFVERAPYSSRGGAKCKLVSCLETIKPGSYRIALSPSMDPIAARYRTQSLDFFHIKCFEKIADFSQSDFHKRVLPVTGRYAGLRGLKINQSIDGNYLCDGGAERLVMKWKKVRGRALDARDGVEAEDEPVSPEIINLLYKAGSAGFKAESIEGMTPFGYEMLSTRLAPWESDGPEDEAGWNLFDQYLVTSKTEDRHTLSETLDKWGSAKYLAKSEDAALSDETKRQNEDHGEKGRRAIRRLSAVSIICT